MSKLLKLFGVLWETRQVESNSIEASGYAEDTCQNSLTIFIVSLASEFTIVCCLLGRLRGRLRSIFIQRKSEHCLCIVIRIVEVHIVRIIISNVSRFTIIQQKGTGAITVAVFHRIRETGIDDIIITRFGINKKQFFESGPDDSETKHIPRRGRIVCLFTLMCKWSCRFTISLPESNTYFQRFIKIHLLNPQVESIQRFVCCLPWSISSLLVV